MTIKRINEFPEGSGSLSNDDVFLFMDDPSNGGTTKKISLSQISAAVADIINAASLPTTGLTITKTGDWAAQSPSQFFTLVPPQAIQINNTYTRYSGKWITAWSYSESSYSTTGGSRISALSFDDLQGLTSTFTPSNMAALTTLSLPVLSYVAGTFNPSNMAALTTLSLPVLSYVGFGFNPSNMAALTTLSLPVLSYVAGTFNPNTMAALTTLSLPVLSYVGSSFSPNTMAALTTLSLPALSYVGFGFNPSNMAALTTLSLPALSYVAGTFNPSNMAALTTLSLPALSYVAGTFNPSNMAALTTLSLPVLSYVGGSFNPSNMAALANVTLPTNGTLKNILGDVAMTGMALTVASVDNILQALASLDGTNGTTSYGSPRAVNISGGTSAAPSNLGSVTVTLATSPTLPNLVCSGTTCTVNMTAHGYAVGDVLRVSGVTGATNANRYAVVATVPNANQFTYTTVNTASPTNGAGQMNIVKASNNVKTLVTRGVSLTTM